jgi:hypothetical protein
MTQPRVARTRWRPAADGQVSRFRMLNVPCDPGCDFLGLVKGILLWLLEASVLAAYQSWEPTTCLAQTESFPSQAEAATAKILKGSNERSGAAKAAGLAFPK